MTYYMENGYKVSQTQVLCSAAGYYIGRTYIDNELGGAELPYDRQSVEYYRTHEEAQSALDNGTYTVRHNI